MSSDEGWDRLTLKSAGVVLIDCDHRTPSAAESGYPYIAIPQLKDGHIALDGARLISESDYSDWTKKLSPQGHDVIVVRRCNSGDSAHVPEGLQCAIGQNLVVLRADGTRVLPQYLRWLVRGTEWWDEVGKYINVGAVFDSLRCRDIPNFSLPIPSLDEQREIATILASLDDRITLLRETNATLEGIAQALFKSWFVDFDPVRAKMEGRIPEGMDEATAALFPDGFEESELGLVPKRWAINRLDEHVTADRGLSYKGAGLAQRGRGVPMHNLNSVLEGGGYKYAGIKFYSGEFKDKHQIRSGEIVVTNTEQGHDHRLIGFPAIVPKVYSGEAIFSHHLYRVRLLDNSPLSISFVYRMLMTPTVREQIVGCANGSTVNMLKVIGLQAPKFVCPTAEICRVFALIASPIQDSMEANVERMEGLSSLRDTLLPRLISGQLRVPEALEELEAA